MFLYITNIRSNINEENVYNPQHDHIGKQSYNPQHDHIGKQSYNPQHDHIGKQSYLIFDNCFHSKRQL